MSRLPRYNSSGIQVVLFAYTGTGIIGLAATETQEPEKTVPPAARLITFAVVGIYVFSIIFIIAFLPGKLDENISPFVAIFHLIRIPYASDVVNFIILTAGLSALNSQVYSASRMLFSLAKAEQAPKFTAYQNSKGVPIAAVSLSGVVLLFTVFASFLFPHKLFIYLVTASGFLALVNWGSVCLTQYYYRKKVLKLNPNKLKYRAPGYPYLTWACFISIVIIIFTAPLFSDQLPGLYTAIILLLLISVAYFFTSLNKKT